MKKRLTNKQKKQITRDCWDLDYAFLKWLQPRLVAYLKDADKFVDLEYNKFTINDIEMTQKEAIQRMIFLVDNLLDDGECSLYWNDPIEYEKFKKEFCLIWAEVMPAMWW